MLELKIIVGAKPKVLKKCYLRKKRLTITYSYMYL